MSTTMIGRKLGAYTITAELGRGGMANVYRAEQPSIGREVAIKVLPAHFLQDPTFVKRFEREVQVIAKLQHPHILPVYDFGEDDGMPYIVMALMPGGTLADIMSQTAGLPLEEVSRLVDQIADGLDHAHEKGIIHRDFKPGNVLLDEHHNVYLADFGIAKVAESASQITGSGIIGTPAYMAPESSQTLEVTPLVDIYALGVTLFEMLAGQHPYPSVTPVGAMMAHAAEPIPEIAMYRPELPPGLQNVIDRAMAKDPAQRYQSAGALAVDLRAVLRGDSPATEQMPGLRPASHIGPGAIAQPLETVAVTVKSPERARPPETAPRQTIAIIGGAVVVIALAVGLIALAGNGMFSAAPKPISSGPNPSATPRGWLKTFAGHKDAVGGLAFSPDGKTLASGSSDRKVILWDVADGAKQLSLDLPDEVYSLGFYPDGKTISAGGQGGSVSFWDASSGSQLFKQDFLPAGQVSLAVTPDGSTYAVASRDISIALFDAKTFAHLRAVDYPASVWSVAYSPDGKILASGMGDGSIILRDSQSDQDIRTLTIKFPSGKTASGTPSTGKGGVTALAFSPDGKWLATAGSDAAVSVWDVATGEQTLIASSESAPIGSLAWLPDSKSLVAADQQGTIIRWDVASGDTLQHIPAREVASLAVSPDGTLIASGMADGTIMLWKVE